MKAKYALAGALLLSLLLTGCSKLPDLPVATETATPAPEAKAEAEASPTAYVSKQPFKKPEEEIILTNEPAELHSNVPTEQRVVSVVFEGYSDDDTMNQITRIAYRADVPTVFFVTGKAADEHEDILQNLKAYGFEMGNFGMDADSQMENNTVRENLAIITGAQELITEAVHETPELIRCNRSEYTDELLKTVAAAELKGAVQPTLYLNHRSFSEKADATKYVSNLIRGSVISIKLGSELTTDEYGDSGVMLDEKPAIDPQPSLEEGSLKTKAWNYDGVVGTVEWLFDALKEAGYRVVPVDELAQYENPELAKSYNVDAATMALTDITNYTEYPVTEQPLGTLNEKNTEKNMEGVVFVGGAETQALESYVTWRQKQDPSYMEGVQFLTLSGMTVEGLLQPVTDFSAHPIYSTVKEDGTEAKTKASLENALSSMGAKKVYLMLKYDNSKAYAQEQYLENMHLLVYLIKRANPDVEVVIQSLLPGSPSSKVVPTNWQIFRLNLMTYRMCKQYDIPFIDVAYYLRDGSGKIKPAYCVDSDNTASHLSDDGYEAWLNVVRGLK